MLNKQFENLSEICTSLNSDDVKKMGHPVKTIATVYENTDYGTSIAETLRKAIKEKGFDLIAEIAYAANTTDVSSQVLQLTSSRCTV